MGSLVDVRSRTFCNEDRLTMGSPYISPLLRDSHTFLAAPYILYWTFVGGKKGARSLGVDDAISDSRAALRLVGIDERES